MTEPAAEPQTWLWSPYAALGLKIALATLVIDQAHKWWMLLVYKIQDKGRVPVLPFLDLVFVKNTGISYSMLDQSSYSWQLGLSAFAVLASGALWVWLNVGATNRLMAWSIALIVGGALGNAIDRMALGYVVDFLWFHVQQYSWPAFNVADSAIDLGAALLLWDNFHSSKTHKN